MKTIKLSVLLLALVSVFTFSSCLNDSDESSLPTYSSYVTISGDAFIGYTFYSDFGCTLVPTQASVAEVLPGLGTSNAKRAVIAFDLANEAENGQALEAGKRYNIVLRSSYYANYAIPTYESINITNNTMATDSLTNNNKQINYINSEIWAINGFVNAQLTINYDPNKAFYLNTYYDREKDIDAENNTLYLNLYYNHNSVNPSTQGSSVFSFDLPDEAAMEFRNDSINVVLRANTLNEFQMTEVGKCRMAWKDFFVPEF